MKDLKNKVAVVTGAGSGIGKAISVHLAEKGCDLALADINEPGLKETENTIRSLGRKTSIHIIDVSDKNQMEAFPKAVLNAHGHIHILVNNAGVYAISEIEKQSINDIAWIIGINFWGVVFGCKFFLPYLKKEDNAHIVNMSSLNGFVGFPTQAMYCATKSAVRGFSEALWAELRHTGVGLTVIHPGGVKTNIFKSLRSSSESTKSKWINATESGLQFTPEKAARKIVRGIERNKMQVLFCPETHAIYWTKRFFPDIMHYLVAYIYRKSIRPGTLINRFISKSASR